MKVTHTENVSICRRCGVKTRRSLMCARCGGAAYAEGVRHPQRPQPSPEGAALLIREFARDLRFTPGNDQLWGAGQWVKCPCVLDSFDRPTFHHRGAHG